MIITELKEDQISTALARVSTALTDMTPLMQEIGDLMVKSTWQNFQDGAGPDGKKWAAKSQATIDNYIRKGGRVDFRPLHGRFGFLSSTISAAATGQSVEWGSNRIQAAVMQFGAKKGQFGTAANASPIPWGPIPARPYLGISDKDRANILATIEDYLESAAGSGID